ncbi:MAG: FAD-dependent oxidoreductase [Planctomycetota bacterium]
MTLRVLVIGGGLSGLSAAWQLHRHGVEATLLEARPRLGGRVLSIPVGEGSFDMGPSWIWEGQPCVHGLLEHFGIPTYEQYCDGDLIHQSATGKVFRNSLLKPMMGSRRICGGVGKLVKKFAAAIPANLIRLSSTVASLNCRRNGITVSGHGPEAGFSLDADLIALALPLRIASGLDFNPPLEGPALDLLRSTPTWMAGHAKFLAIYETAFWREQGLSGDVLSVKGPLAEVHEATPDSGSPHSLLGFIGINALARRELSEDQLIECCLEHLSELFGSSAGSPTSSHIVDWSREELTASEADLTSHDHHPEYGVKVPLSSPWGERLHFIASETSRENGGLIEGAISQGLCFADSLLKKIGIDADRIGTLESCDPHSASMSWDWIEE